MHRVLAFIAVCLLVLPGCSKRDAATSATGDAATAASRPGAQIRVVYIPKSSGNPYFDASIKGFQKAAQELGFSFESLAPASADATSQLPFIKAQIQQKVDVLAICPNSPDALNPVLKEALAKGIKVITVDADTTGDESARLACVLPMDFNITGSSQIELMGSLMDYKGEFAILSATSDAPNQNFWIKGMMEALKDPKYREMKLVATVYGNDELGKSTTEAQALLTKYPNLKGILAPTSVGITAAAQVVQTAGKEKQVMVTGLGSPNQMRRYIQNGTVRKFALWNPMDMGYIAGHLAYGLAKGEIQPAPGTSFKVGTLGERVFGPKNVVISGPPLIFDKSNIEQFNF